MRVCRVCLVTARHLNALSGILLITAALALAAWCWLHDPPVAASVAGHTPTVDVPREGEAAGGTIITLETP